MPQILVVRNSTEMKNILDNIKKAMKGDKAHVHGAMTEDANAIMQQLFDSGALKAMENAGIHHIMVPTSQGILTGLSSEGDMGMLKDAKKCSCGTCTCKDKPKAAPEAENKSEGGLQGLEGIIGDVCKMLGLNPVNVTYNGRNQAFTAKVDDAAAEAKKHEGRELLSKACSKLLAAPMDRRYYTAMDVFKEIEQLIRDGVILEEEGRNMFKNAAFSVKIPQDEVEKIMYEVSSKNKQPGSCNQPKNKGNIALLCEKVKHDLYSANYVEEIMHILTLSIKELADIVKTGEVDKQTAFASYRATTWGYLNACIRNGKYFASDIDTVWKSTNHLWEELTKPVNPTKQNDETDDYKAFDAELRRAAYAIANLPRGKNVQILFEDQCCNLIDNVKAKNLIEGLDKSLCMDNILEVLFTTGFICGALHMEEKSFEEIRKLVQSRWEDKDKK